jgi:ribonuclease P protein component
MIVRPLKGVRAVRQAFAGPLRVRSGPIAGIGSAANSAHVLSFVVVVGKHRVRRAVDRNRIKRLIREALRAAANTATASGKDNSLATLIVRWQGGSQRTLSFGEVAGHVQGVFDNLLTASAKPRGNEAS